MSPPVRRQIEQLTQLIDELRKTQQEIIATSRQRTGWLRTKSATVTNKLCKTPAGGIAAMTGSGTGGDPYVFGSAGCYPIDVSTGVTGGTANVTVKNSTSLAIGGDVVIQVKEIDGINFADVAEGCGS